jgi:riboflavin biosynthesis pyrimidine reductase
MKFAPLDPLLQTTRGKLLPLTPKLTRLYGEFRMPQPRARLHVYSNFVSTLDGVVSLQARGHSGGGDISGFSAQDRMIMGLLRAAADVVIVGAGTLAADPYHVWTPQAICPELAADYRRLEIGIAKRSAALNVVVSASGGINLSLPVFTSGKVPVMIVTTEVGAKRLSKQKPRDGVKIHAVRTRLREIPAASILEELQRVGVGTRVLVEGGPQLMGAFYKERLIDEQFLSLAPQIAGRQLGDTRPGFVMGKHFAPRDPLWGTLLDARRGTGLLFLRYSFAGAAV